MGVLLASLYSCQFQTEFETTQKKKFSENNQYPLEWMYNQRAYPNNYINKQAMEDLLESLGL